MQAGFLQSSNNETEMEVQHEGVESERGGEKNPFSSTQETQCSVASSKTLLSAGLQGKRAKKNNKKKTGSYGKNMRGRDRNREVYTFYL